MIDLVGNLLSPGDHIAFVDGYSGVLKLAVIIAADPSDDNEIQASVIRPYANTLASYSSFDERDLYFPVVHLQACFCVKIEKFMNSEIPPGIPWKWIESLSANELANRVSTATSFAVPSMMIPKGYDFLFNKLEPGDMVIFKVIHKHPGLGRVTYSPYSSDLGIDILRSEGGRLVSSRSIGMILPIKISLVSSFNSFYRNDGECVH